ncbi:extracellular solute-binding protein [Paenibacillus radicis (ex Gao et al. 2016)]|uniref:Sugar ABC transporter substrate-binding protein n=1 Tax=Paenibacillus radicis (ex Gao et al. 2016) TaxID=1737354 RepID=A0A917GWQ4_9BACL|nr:extracellular solute-binding protein [Paenibacillus radicis (ex Gao et al. 2016)]GGG59696.1 sugar ABC transporter substrate-binding protein [Paenibacillus radicis (ex Gao et al. 2016)]
MTVQTLRVALIEGPAYNPLYQIFEKFERDTGIHVSVSFLGAHPDLNRHVGELFDSGKCNYDLISTHTKYAPSQAAYLMELDDYFMAEELNDFSPALIELARVQGKLKSIPRNFDARLLFYQTDKLQQLGLDVPQTWQELYEAAVAAKEQGCTGFAYPGMESGLFGTFFELLVSRGGELFDERLQPAFDSEAGREALHYLKRMYEQGLTPQNLPDMHYDEVSQCFRDGECMMVTDWPGYYQLLLDPSRPAAGRFGLALTPADASGKRSVYCGSHSFAVTASTQKPEQAVSLLKYLTSQEAQSIDAVHGHVPVRGSVLDSQKKSAPAGSLEAQRWSLLDETMATCVIIPPKFPEYPETEDLLWKALQDGITGKLPVEDALKGAAANIGRIVSRYA